MKQGRRSCSPGDGRAERHKGCIMHSELTRRLQVGQRTFPPGVPPHAAVPDHRLQLRLRGHPQAGLRGGRFTASVLCVGTRLMGGASALTRHPAHAHGELEGGRGRRCLLRRGWVGVLGGDVAPQSYM